jgi:hypothetical protein
MSKRTRLLNKLKHVYSHNAKLVLDVSNDDIGLIIEGVEKQIKKKPLHSIYYPNGRKHHHIYCGKCGMYRQRVSMSDNYCRNCGTKIDWSESDD